MYKSWEKRNNCYKKQIKYHQKYSFIKKWHFVRQKDIKNRQKKSNKDMKKCMTNSSN